MCVFVQQNILNSKKKRDKIFVDEVKTLWRENHSGSAKPRKSTIQRQSKLQSILTKPIVVVIPLTITRSLSWTLPNQVCYLKGSLMESFTLGPTPKIDFTRTVEHTPATTRELTDLQISLNTLSKHYGILYWILTNNKPRAIYLWASENLILDKFGLWLWSVWTITYPRPDGLLHRLSRIVQFFP